MCFRVIVKNQSKNNTKFLLVNLHKGTYNNNIFEI